MAEALASISNASADVAAAADEEDPSSRVPHNAEDRKAAAALKSLNVSEITQEGAGGTTARQPSKADQEALGKAMSRLEIAHGTGAASKGNSENKITQEKKDAATEVNTKKVKVAAEDVNLLVGLPLSRSILSCQRGGNELTNLTCVDTDQ
jgi:hypothetical protein